jgi:hypothetical protein
MTRLLKLAAAAAVAQLAALGDAASQSAHAQSSPSLYITGGAVIMKRSTPDNGTSVAANPAGTPFQTGNDFKFDWDTGFDGTLGVRFMGRHAIELRFLGIESNASNIFATPGAFIGGGFTGPGGTLFDTTYDTTLRNWELNWRYLWTNQLTLLAGFRAINLEDSQRFRLGVGPVAQGWYDYDNRLRGAQIGIDWSVLPTTSALQINLSGKVGLFHLKSEGGIELFSGSNPIGGFGTKVSDTVVAGELGVSVGYRIHDNVTLRAGYQMLVIDDVGLASNNASASLLNPALLSNNVYRDSILYHGANLGMTINW